jgi:cation diffusion facilitator CzcD-associated flavoprotein CzcO
MSMQEKRNPSVIIIGAGMTGILMCIRLREIGVTDITILEKKHDIGGTWLQNTYPGLTCDVPAHMYTYEFERNPDWSHRYAHGSEIQAYFKKVARKYGVEERVRVNEAVTDAHYNRGKWTVKTSQGATLSADFLVSASGVLHHPIKPKFEGDEKFKGAIFHTSEWDHSVELKNKRVAIIGTGSTSVQVIGELHQTVDKLSVFQRSAQWVLPAPNRSFTEKEKEKCRTNPFRIPMTNLVYGTIFEHVFSKGVIGKKLPYAIMKFLCKRNLRKKVRDPDLRQKLTPDFQVGCRRLIMNGNFYESIQQPNVELVTEGIKCFTETGIETVDGKHHDLDAVVLSTGYSPTAFMRPMNLVGKSGTDIDTHWMKKIQAYRSCFMPDYPNFFLMLGPNTPIGNFSVIRMSEVQTDYIMKLIERWRNNEFDEVATTPEAVKHYNQYIKEGMGKTVWVTGCKSWYLDADGDPMSWPYTWGQWVREMKEPEMSDFVTASFGSQCEGEAAEVEVTEGEATYSAPFRSLDAA